MPRDRRARRGSGADVSKPDRELTFQADRPPEIVVTLTQVNERIIADLLVGPSRRMAGGLSRPFPPGVDRGLFEQELVIDLLGTILAGLVEQGKL